MHNDVLYHCVTVNVHSPTLNCAVRRSFFGVASLCHVQLSPVYMVSVSLSICLSVSECRYSLLFVCLYLSHPLVHGQAAVVEAGVGHINKVKSRSHRALTRMRTVHSQCTQGRGVARKLWTFEWHQIFDRIGSERVKLNPCSGTSRRYAVDQFDTR